MKKKKKTIAFVTAIIFSIVFSLMFKWAQTGSPFRAETIMYGIIVFLNILILGSISYRLLNKNSNKSSQHIKKNLIPSFILFVLVALIISLSLVSLGVYSFFLIKGLDTSHFLQHLFSVELSSAIKQFSFWILLGSAFFFYIIWRKAIDREQNLREENLKYKYQNLKSQVNPHFLFNSLNTLSEIVYEDAKKADRYIQMLSRMYRYILENEETDLISLDKEIEFVQNYIGLQKAGDNDRIQLEIILQDSHMFSVVPVSVQILVENAIKHNSSSAKNPLKIHIYSNDSYIVVSNNIQRKSILENTSKKGLINLKERVKLIIDREVIIQEDIKQYIVKLPLIRVPV